MLIATVGVAGRIRPYAAIQPGNAGKELAPQLTLVEQPV
jgi:hypothetical protein